MCSYKISRLNSKLGYISFDLFFKNNIFKWFAEDKEMDVDTSETAAAGTVIKFDLQSAGSNVGSTALEGSVIDDKQDTFGSINVKTSNIADRNGQKSSINDESSSIPINRPTKSELQFRNDTSSAISRNINLDSDVPAVTESDSLEVEIKQEDPCSSPNTPLPPHAMSKIQVCIRREYVNFIFIE